MRCVPQPAERVGPEKPKPGRDGMTRWNAGSAADAGSVSGLSFNLFTSASNYVTCDANAIP